MIASKSATSTRHGGRGQSTPPQMPLPGEDSLDQALADSFPASDPPAQVSQGTISNPNPREKKKREQ